MWGKCQRYVKETRRGVEVNLGGGYGPISGQAGIKIAPEVQRLADKALLYLDIAQHYYCTQAEEAEKQARKARYEGEKSMYMAHQKEMLGKRDETFQRMVELATKGKESHEALTASLREHERKLLEYSRGITDKKVVKSLKGLQEAYSDARPFHVQISKGIDTGGGSITAQGPVVGKIETGGGDVAIGDHATIHKGLSKEEVNEMLEKYSNKVYEIFFTKQKEFLMQVIKPMQEELQQKDLELSQKERELVAIRRDLERVEMASRLVESGIVRREVEKYREPRENYMEVVQKFKEDTEKYNTNLMAVLGKIESTKVRENMVRAVVKKLTEMEQEMRQEEMRSNIKLGEGWVKALGD